MIVICKCGKRYILDAEVFKAESNDNKEKCDKCKDLSKVFNYGSGKQKNEALKKLWQTQ